MKLEGQKTIPAPIERTWAALNDPEILKASIPGCESMEQTGENEYTAALKIRIGPVNARFKGKLGLSDVVPPHSYRIAFEGQGGAAGFGKGNADVRLESDGASTLLNYVAQAQVGGKIAQIGSRLIDAAAAKIAADFFTAFEEQLAAEAPAETSAEVTVAAPADAPAQAPTAAPADTTAAPTRAAAAPAPAPVSPPPAPGPSGAGGSKVIWWIIGAAIIIALGYAFLS